MQDEAGGLAGRAVDWHKAVPRRYLALGAGQTTGPDRMDDDDRDFEHSSLSGAFTCDGEIVEVEIYRFVGETYRWRMEVVHLSGCVRWKTTFATEAEAHAAFLAMIEVVGIRYFVGDRSKARH